VKFWRTPCPEKQTVIASNINKYSMMKYREVIIEEFEDTKGDI
jgi:hypothetical protein